MVGKRSAGTRQHTERCLAAKSSVAGPLTYWPHIFLLTRILRQQTAHDMSWDLLYMVLNT